MSPGDSYECSLDDVKKMTSACGICCEIKPKFFKPPIVNLIKSSQPFERLSMDFKGPLHSKTKNYYIFTVVDEFFTTVISCLDHCLVCLVFLLLCKVVMQSVLYRKRKNNF